MGRQLKLIRIVGARPQFMQAAPLSRALKRSGHQEIMVHTGQHYDDLMSRVFFDELALAPPDVNLDVGSGSHGEQTGRMLEKIEEYVIGTSCDGLVVDGDTNSTVAGALVAAKLNIPLVHVESGVRCGDRSQPEEINRIVTDHTADLLCAPTADGLANLHREGLGNRSVQTGDLLYDCFQAYRHRVAERRSPADEVRAGGYLLATVHRAENTDDENRMDQILAALSTLTLPVLFPVHPRTRPSIERYRDRGGETGMIQFMDPLGYLDILAIVMEAQCVLTDSGGLEREAFFSGVPVIVLRESTCWTEQIKTGRAVLAGWRTEHICASFQQIMQSSIDESGPDPSDIFGNGNAAERIVAEIEQLLGKV